MDNHFTALAKTMKDQMEWDSILVMDGQIEQDKNGWNKVTFYFKQDEV